MERAEKPNLQKIPRFLGGRNSPPAVRQDGPPGRQADPRRRPAADRHGDSGRAGKLRRLDTDCDGRASV